MPRRLLIILLAAGTLGGYASGFASLARHHRRYCHERFWDDRAAHRFSPAAFPGGPGNAMNAGAAEPAPCTGPR